MKGRCLVLGLAAFWAATEAACLTPDQTRGSRSPRRYQPKTTFCSECQPQHLHLLLTSPVEASSKKCFTRTETDTSSIRDVLSEPSSGTFVLVAPKEDSMVDTEVLTAMAEVLGNVSVLLSSGSSVGQLSKRCLLLGPVCHGLSSLLPVLEQVERHESDRSSREVMKNVFGVQWGDLRGEGQQQDSQQRRLMVELCKRGRTRNQLIEVRQESGFPKHSEQDDDFKSGLSLKDILPLDAKSYDKNRPPKSKGQPTVVHFHVTVLSLDSINEESMTYVADIFLAQSWRDPRLRLPENMSEEYRILDVDWLRDIWRPDCFFKNAKQVTFHEISIPNHYVWLYRDKTLLYMSKLTLVLSCAMKFEAYPHDIQVCSMMIESLSHTVRDLIFLWNFTDPLVVNPEIELPQLDLASNYTSDCTVQYSTGNFTCLAVMFTLKRRLGYHLLHTYIPSALIVVMSWISFWIKPEAIPARVTLGVTSLLTLATQNTQSQQSLPPVSYVKAIDIWMSSCSVFVFLSLMEFAIVNNYMGPISGKALVGYSEDDLRVHATLAGPRNPTCYGKEAALCIDRFSRYFFPFSFFVLNAVYWSVFI